jgi:hypothetical protein
MSRVEYDQYELESFIVSKHCMNFSDYYSSYHNRYKTFYIEGNILFDSSYLQTILDEFKILDGYSSPLWINVRRRVNITKKISPILFSCIIEYMAEIMSDFFVFITGSMDLLLKYELLKVASYNKKLKLKSEFHKKMNSIYICDFMDHHKSMINISHQRLLSTIRTCSEKLIDPPIIK